MYEITRAVSSLPIKLCGRNNSSLWLYQATETSTPLHIAFGAEMREQVDAFFRVALHAGGKDNGASGLRKHYHANYYAAFVIGPDRHNIEAVYHDSEA